MVSGRTRLWLRDPRVCALTKVSTAAVIPFNVPRTTENDAWLVKRDKLIDSWTRLNMYDPETTWGEASSEADKVTMVLLDTSNTHTHTHLCVHFVAYLCVHFVAYLCVHFVTSPNTCRFYADVFILVSVFYFIVSMFSF